MSAEGQAWLAERKRKREEWQRQKAEIRAKTGFLRENEPCDCCQNDAAFCHCDCHKRDGK